MTCAQTGLSSCGCCQNPIPETRHNRPGLEAIAYRLGTHSSFVREMQYQISKKTLKEGPHSHSRPLAALGTRESDDPSIALLDSAAMMLDVLTFYQERIANEGFLGTATERLSILEMARAIGYELSPGVAADVTLVFTLDEKPGKAPSTTKIAAGTRVQSLPSDGDLPQTFETVSDFTAYKAWNKLKPRQVYDQELSVNSTGSLQRNAFGTGTETATEIEFTGTSLLIEPGDLLVAHVGVGSTKGTAIARVVTVEEDTDREVTTMGIEIPSDADYDTSSIPGGGSFGPALTAPAEMNDANVAKVLATERTESDLQILLEELDWDVDEFLEAVNPDPDAEENGVEPHAINGVFVLRRRAGMFGHNAQPYKSLPATHRKGERVKQQSGTSYTWVWVTAPYPYDWEGRDIWEDSQGGDYGDALIFLEREEDDVLDEGWIVLDGKTTSSRIIRAYRIEDKVSASLADYGLSGKVTGLELEDADGTSATESGFLVRKTTAHVASEWLELADLEIPDPVEDSTVELDRMVLGLAKDQDVIVTGELTDPEGVIGTEVATIEEVNHQHGRTTLTFDEDLTNSYVRDTVVIYGNVVRATHGETVEQPLGSGDGSIPNQSFELRTSPLTYIAASKPSGSESTLELRVNGRLWDEVRSLHAKGPAEEVFTVRTADDQKATVTLGDGRAGARPATGTENITALYRTGIGPAGEVDAETIQLLMTRPPGVKTVDNPLPASGAEAPETFATAQKNAPMTVRTLDRVVSLTDFEDFAATFAGIGKARADVLRLHGQRLVHLTVGSSSGGKVSDSKIKRLVTAIDKARDPGEAVCVTTYRPLSFDVYGVVNTDKKLEHEEVMADVRKALLKAFSFAARRFAQPASVSEIMEVIHTVDGVIATDIDKLEVKGGPAITIIVPPLGVMASRPARLKTGATSLGCEDIDPADLLLINRNGINLEKMA